MTIEDRLARLERRNRALMVGFVLVLVVSACANVPPLRAQMGRYVPNWVTDRDGYTTYGDTLHHTGATAEIIGGANNEPNAGLSIMSPDEVNGEAFLIQGFMRPNGGLVDSAGKPTDHIKAMSFSTLWAKRPFPGYRDDPVFLARIGTTYMGPDMRRRDAYIGLMQCGGYGTVFYPQNATNGAECPSEPDAVAFTGNTYLRKDVYITGKLFVNGIEVR